MADKYVADNAGQLEEVEGLQTSAGAGDAGKIAALDSTGKWDVSMMPVGIAPLVKTYNVSEAVLAGDFVNLWDNGGTLEVRKADATDPAKKADGYVLAAQAVIGQPVDVYFEDFNNQVAGLIAGDLGKVAFLSDTTPGRVTTTAPSGAGEIVQRLGKVLSLTEMTVEIAQPVKKA
jgi:hypothetical protein